MVGITDSEWRRRADGPTLTAEAALIARHGGPVAGIDEAGRGPWAGPVVAAAVILDPDRIPSGLNDSKLLSPRLREALYDEISATARVAVGIAEVPRIDAENILQATLWAMRAALRDLGEAPAAALVDGNRCPDLPCPARVLVGGDGLSVSVAAASIVAKVTRDRLMIALADECPGYGWERNKGYGTREHGEALQRLGVTRHHRRSFAPVRAVIENGG
jgi:ribonuclease HII